MMASKRSSSSASSSSFSPVELRASVLGRPAPFVFTVGSYDRISEVIRIIEEEEARIRLTPVPHQDHSTSYQPSSLSDGDTSEQDDGMHPSSSSSSLAEMENKENSINNNMEKDPEEGWKNERRLVVLPRPLGSVPPRPEGAILDPQATVGSLQLTSEDTLVMMENVVLMNVHLETGDPSRSLCAKVPIDFHIKLRHSYSLLRNTFASELNEDDFALLYSAATIDVNAIDGINRWITVNESPRDQKLDPEGKITVCPIPYLLTLPANTKYLIPAEKEGFLHFKQPLKARRSGTHGKKFWFHIKEYLLIVWRSQVDLTSKKVPKRVIPLDHYFIQPISEEGPVYTFSLKKDPTLGIPTTALAREVFGGLGSEPNKKVKQDINSLYQVSAKDQQVFQKWMQTVQAKCVNAEEMRVFGVELKNIMTRKREKHKIPNVLHKCILYLDEYGLDKEGIFRVSGNALEIEAYKQAFDNCEDVDFRPGIDVHVVSSLMKQYLREMPEPLLTYEMYDCFVVAHSQLRNFNPDKATVARKMVELLVGLSPHYYNALKILTEFLSRVAQHSEKNLMHLSNLSTIFGPNLLRRPEGSNGYDLFQDVSVVTEIAETLISQHEEIFRQVGEKEGVARRARVVTLSPRSRSAPRRSLTSSAPPPHPSADLPAFQSSPSLQAPSRPASSPLSPRSHLSQSASSSSLHSFAQSSPQGASAGVKPKERSSSLGNSTSASAAMASLQLSPRSRREREKQEEKEREKQRKREKKEEKKRLKELKKKPSKVGDSRKGA